MLRITNEQKRAKTTRWDVCESRKKFIRKHRSNSKNEGNQQSKADEYHIEAIFL
jgi:hypothetical protein